MCPFDACPVNHPSHRPCIRPLLGSAIDVRRARCTGKHANILDAAATYPCTYSHLFSLFGFTHADRSRAFASLLYTTLKLVAPLCRVSISISRIQRCPAVIFLSSASSLLVSRHPPFSDVLLP